MKFIIYRNAGWVSQKIPSAIQREAYDRFNMESLTLTQGIFSKGKPCSMEGRTNQYTTEPT